MALQRLEYPLIGLDPDLVIVTGVPAVGKIEFSNADGVEVAPPQTVTETWHGGLDSTTQLARLVLAMGEGRFTAREIHDATGLPYMHLRYAMPRIGEVMPDEVAYFDEGEGPDNRHLALGYCAVAWRRPTTEETAIYKASVDSDKESTVERYKQEILAMDGAKIDLTAHDHARIWVGDDEVPFYLPLDSPDAIVAARVLSELSEKFDGRNKDYLDKRTTTTTSWRSMPIAERSLFSDKDSVIYAGASAKIKDETDLVFESLTSPMGITQRGPTASVYRRRTDALRVEFFETPLTAEEQSV